MTVFPGTEPPVFEVGSAIETDGFEEKKITMFSHTGTHMDAPAHIIPGARKLDQFPIEKFCGQGVRRRCERRRRQARSDWMRWRLEPRPFSSRTS